MSGHPSRLALDRLALGVADEVTKGHAAACAQCAAHLAAVRVDLPIPAWVGQVGQSKPFSWWRPAFALVAMSAIALVAVFTPTGGPDIQAKGVGKPSVQVWLNRAGQVDVWSGAALRPDDAFRFELKPGGFKHLTVVELQEGRLHRVLHSAPIASDGLSPAWAVDAEGSQEEVVVLLSTAPLSEEELQRALAGEGSVWSSRFRFPKEVR